MHSTLNVWRQLIAVVRCLVAPSPSDHWCTEVRAAQVSVPDPDGVIESVHNCIVMLQEKDDEWVRSLDTIEAHGRTWRTGPPPHVGWWNASTSPRTSIAEDVWRWWDGKRWSLYRDVYMQQFAHASDLSITPVWWSDYYPDNAVVPRMTPEQWKERARAASNQ